MAKKPPPAHEAGKGALEITGELGGVRFDLKVGGIGGKRPLLALLEAVLSPGEEPPEEQQ